MPAVLAVRQGNVNTLQHLQSDHRSGARIKLFLNLLIQFYLNNVTNIHQLTSQSMKTCPTTQRS